MKEWVSISEAAHCLGITERAVRYRIDKGALESKLEADKRLVLIDIPAETISEVSSEALLKQLMQEKESQVEQLKEQLQEKDEQIAELHQIIAIAHKNIDRVTEQNNFLLEDLRPGKRWYHRLCWWNNNSANSSH